MSLPLLCYDTIFKAVFSSEENILAKMVSDITGIDFELLKDNVVLETNELPISTNNEKVKRCDFVLKINDGSIINLELNAHSYVGMIVKNLSYLFGLFSTSFKQGEKYDENLIVMQININCFKTKHYEDIKPLAKYHLREDVTNKLYVKNVAIYELNVVKCFELYYNIDNKDNLPNYIKWGALIYSNSIEEISEITNGILDGKEREIIMENLNKLTREDLFYTQEEALKWAEWERNSIRDEARKEGLKEGRAEGVELGIQEGIERGIQEGIEQGIEQGTKQTIKEMILALKENGADLEFISKVTKKPLKEINKIIKEQ